MNQRIPPEAFRLPPPRKDDEAPEHLTQGGAERLAARIVEYWARFGLFPRVWVTKETAVKRNGVVSYEEGLDLPFGAWVVRSDMTGGLPA